MPDLSHLDDRYFVSSKTYNCPFCNRRHVTYTLKGWSTFSWNDRKAAWAYFVECNSCNKRSMHLSYSNLIKEYVQPAEFKDVDLDAAFFVSIPSSFHVIDERIPSEIRELLSEAEGCLKSNFLTGASACVRKIVYELAVREKAEGENYDDRIKSLKAKLPHVDSTYFDTLLTIQQLTSDKVHENSYDGWQGTHLRVILAALLEALNQIYVVPAEREGKRLNILRLKGEVFGQRGKADGAGQ